MPADGEVKEIDRLCDAPIDPHPRRDAAPILRLRSRDHLASTAGLRIISMKWNRRVLHDQGYGRVVGGDDWTGPHHLPEVRDEWLDELRRRRLNVQKRAPRWRPSTRSKEILLSVDR